MPDTAIVETPSSSTPVAPATSAPSAAAPAAPATPPSSSPSGASSSPFTYAEDRSKWIPPHRLAEETSKRQQLEQRAQQLEAQYQEAQRRIQALAGVTPADPDEANREQVLDALFKVAPWLKEVYEERQQANDPQLQARLAQREQAKWDYTGEQTRQYVFGKLAEASGGDLSPEEQTAIVEGLIDYLRADDDRRIRYEEGDRRVVDEYIARMTWGVERGRRLGTQTSVQRLSRPVPSGRTSAPVVTQRPKPPAGDIDAAMDAATSYLKDRGVAFGG